MVDGLWHALESSRVNGLGWEHKMRCGAIVRVRLGPMTVQGGDPEPTSWCLNCVEKFYYP